jgi:serine/threonine protein kinase
MSIGQYNNYKLLNKTGHFGEIKDGEQMVFVLKPSDMTKQLGDITFSYTKTIVKRYHGDNDLIPRLHLLNSKMKSIHPYVIALKHKVDNIKDLREQLECMSKQLMKLSHQCSFHSLTSSLTSKIGVHDPFPDRQCWQCEELIQYIKRLAGIMDHLDEDRYVNYHIPKENYEGWKELFESIRMIVDPKNIEYRYRCILKSNILPKLTRELIKEMINFRGTLMGTVKKCDELRVEYKKLQGIVEELSNEHINLKNQNTSDSIIIILQLIYGITLNITLGTDGLITNMIMRKFNDPYLKNGDNSEISHMLSLIRGYGITHMDIKPSNIMSDGSQNHLIDLDNILCQIVDGYFESDVRYYKLKPNSSFRDLCELDDLMLNLL